MPPSAVTSTGGEALRLAELAGVELLPWERFVLIASLGERKRLPHEHVVKWSAFEVGLCVPRQNGKNEVALVRQLVGLFLLGFERLIVHSAHLADTAREHFRRLVTVIERTPELDRRVKRIAKSRGDEGIELYDGSRILFKSRKSGGSGRGFTGDSVFMDEAMDLSEDTMGDLVPTLSTREIAQLWYMGSAVDQVQFPDSIVFAGVRARGHAGGDEGLLWVEFCAPGEHPDDLTDADLSDHANWMKANPSLGTLIPFENIERERRVSPRRKFAVERLGVGDWPRTDGLADAVIDFDVWQSREDPRSAPLDPVCLAFDVTPSRTATSIGVAGWRADGKLHVEVVDVLRGTAGAAKRIAEFVDKHAPSKVRCDAGSAAASLIAELAKLGVTVDPVTGPEHGQACGQFVRAVENDELVHLGTTELADAVRGAVKRDIGDAGAWAWSRKSSSVNISPLVAVTLAAGGVVDADPDDEPFMLVI